MCRILSTFLSKPIKWQLAERIHLSSDGVLPASPGGGQKKPDGLQSQSSHISVPACQPPDKIRRVKSPNKQDSRKVMRIREDKAFVRYFSGGPMPRCFCHPVPGVAEPWYVHTALSQRRKKGHTPQYFSSSSPNHEKGKPFYIENHYVVSHSEFNIEISFNRSKEIFNLFL